MWLRNSPYDSNWDFMCFSRLCVFKGIHFLFCLSFFGVSLVYHKRGYLGDNTFLQRHPLIADDKDPPHG